MLTYINAQLSPPQPTFKYEKDEYIFLLNIMKVILYYFSDFATDIYVILRMLLSEISVKFPGRRSMI